LEVGIGTGRKANSAAGQIGQEPESTRSANFRNSEIAQHGSSPACVGNAVFQSWPMQLAPSGRSRVQRVGLAFSVAEAASVLASRTAPDRVVTTIVQLTSSKLMLRSSWQCLALSFMTRE